MSIGLASVEVGLDRQWQSFIDGKFESGASLRTLYNPATGKQLCQVEEAGRKQVEKAIEAARNAFDEGSWSQSTAADRARILRQIADKIEARLQELAHLETLNSGKPLRESRFDIADGVNCLRYYAGLIDKPSGQVIDVPAKAISQTVREPIGVCGQIIPWNYPFQMAVWKLAPALAAGNTCILKPSEYTPLTAIKLAEILQEVELPPGVVNIVLGDGPGAGLPIAESQLVDKLAFTGSGTTGRIVSQAALGNLKKVTLELGGKSPMIVFDDYDVDIAVDYAMFAIFCHAGQVCSAGSRFIVADRIYDEFLARFVERSRKIAVGPGLDEATEMGPLVSRKQLDRVAEYVEIGLQEGATLMLGGDQPSGGRFENGYYLNPTIFAGVNSGMRIVQEEIFGPVAVVEKFSNEKEAIALANETRYGLAGAVFTNDITRAYKVIKAIRCGVTWINGFHSCYNECPFGGYKESGWGRECGTYGLEAYTEVKVINLNMDTGPVNWFCR
jgi:betaine-aldehyde dehydrogenase